MAGEKDLGNLTDNGIVGISISGKGNVGINNTTPTQLLDVTDNSGNCNIFCPEFSVYTILLIVTPKNRIVHNGNMNMSKCILIEHFDHPKNLNFKVFLMSASASMIYFGGSYVKVYLMNTLSTSRFDNLEGHQKSIKDF